MFYAEATVLTVLLGVNPGLTDEQVKEEIMRCFSPAPPRRQAIEKLRAMHQEQDKQMHQYIVRHKLAYLWAHRLTVDEQCNTSEIIEFAINLQPFIQDKLLKKIDGNRPPRSLREACKMLFTGFRPLDCARYFWPVSLQFAGFLVSYLVVPEMCTGLGELL